MDSSKNNNLHSKELNLFFLIESISTLTYLIELSPELQITASFLEQIIPILTKNILSAYTMGNLSAQFKSTMTRGENGLKSGSGDGSMPHSSENNKKQTSKQGSKIKQLEFINRIKSSSYYKSKSGGTTAAASSSSSSSTNGSSSASHGGLSLFSMFYLDYNQFATKGIHYKLNKHQYNSAMQPFLDRAGTLTTDVALAVIGGVLYKKYDKLQSNILNKSTRFLKELEKNVHKRLMCVCFQALAALTPNNEEARRAVSDNSDLIGKLVECIQIHSDVNNTENENMPKGGTAANSLNKKLVRTIFYHITDNENNVKLATSKNLISDEDEDDDDDEDDDEDEEGDENIEENTESSSFEAYFSSFDGGHNKVDMNYHDQAKETNLDGNFVYFFRQ